MTERTESKRSQIEALLQQGKHEDALALIQGLLQKNPHDRELRLYRVLADTLLGKPESHEDEIDAIRSLPELSANERAVARRIFDLGLHAARKDGRSEAAEAYQTLLRSLDLRQPLTQSIPKPPAPSSMAHDSAYMLAFGESERRFFTKSSLAGKVLWILIAAAVLVLIALAYRYFSGDGPVENGGAATTTEQYSHVETRDPIPAIDRAGLKTSGVNAGIVRAVSANQSPPRERKQPAVNSISRVLEENAAEASPKEASTDSAPTDSAQRSSTTHAGPENEYRGVYRMRGPIPIREKPLFSSPIAQKMRRGSTIDVLELRGQWLKVRTHDQGMIGFVRKEFAVPVDPGRR